MTEYRRNFVKGGSYFFTVALADRSQRLLVQHIDSLREAFRCVKAEHPFVLDAMVVLPEHLHCIWTLPTGDANYPDRWRRIKAAFSRSLPDCNFRSPSKILKGERGIWQRRYWEHTLRNQDDWRRHMDYIHYNPVKHQHVARVADCRIQRFIVMLRLARTPGIGLEAVSQTTLGLVRCKANDGLRFTPPILRKPYRDMEESNVGGVAELPPTCRGSCTLIRPVRF